MIKSIGSFVKKKMADVSNSSDPPPRPPPPRPPPPKEALLAQRTIDPKAAKPPPAPPKTPEAFKDAPRTPVAVHKAIKEPGIAQELPKDSDAVQEPSFETESDITEVLNVSGDALDERDLDEILYFVDDDVDETTERFSRISSADLSSKGPTPDLDFDVKSVESVKISQAKPAEVAEDNRPCRSFEQPIAVELDITSKDLSLVNKEESLHASKHSIMDELDSAWGSVETATIEELEVTDSKAAKEISFANERFLAPATGLNKVDLSQIQTVYVAQVSQVSKVYATEATSQVAQSVEVSQEVAAKPARVTREVIPEVIADDASEDPDYAEQTDGAEDPDYTECDTDDELFKRESDFWEVDFDKYMDALLADLQNTITPGGTAPGTPHPHTHNGTSSPSPSPGPSPGPSPNATLIHNHIHNRNGHDPMYHQERVEEVHSEQRSSGGTKMSLNNNLSELDTLLQDLNNARYTGVFKEPSATTNGTVNGSRPSVDSLLDELNSVDTSREIVEQRTVTHEVRTTKMPVSSPPPQQVHPQPPPPQPVELPPSENQASASSATKELDDLMASLSDFKVKEEPPLPSAGPAARPCEGHHQQHTIKVVQVIHHDEPSSELPQAARAAPAVTVTSASSSSIPAGGSGEGAGGSASAPDKLTKVDLTELEEQIVVDAPSDRKAAVSSSTLKKVKKESTAKKTTKMEQKASLSEDSDYEGSTINRGAPPRPPPPHDTDVLAVPPPRPPVPHAYSASPLPTENHVYASPVLIPVRGGVGGGHYIPQHQLTNSPMEDPFHRPPSGGPVKRNDTEYRWVTDATKYEYKEVVDFPCVSEKKQERLRSPALVRKLINASSLQTQVDSAYAKPQKPKSPSPPTPTPTPPTPTPTPPKEVTPPPVNQLDCMLGSLASHMTEQGITTTQKGCCCACDKPIVGQVITALGKTWHPEHFTCTQCNQELGTRNFFERDGKPYCEVDYHNLFSPRCAYCNGPILDKCVTALDKTWHPDHFFCAQCGNTFGEDGFHEKDGKPYCRNDYFNMFAPKCGGCNAPIMDNYISALNAQWHPECFVCRDCRQPFNGGSFFDHEGLPYCETHYHAKRGSLCAGCHKPITGRCITAMFRKYHPEHFVCSFCLKQLNKGTFKEQNDKPYCHGCFDKLFG